MMLAKKDMIDEQHSLLKNLEMSLANATAKLSAADNKDDQAKLESLGVKDTLDAARTFLKESTELTTRIQGKKVQQFLEDEASLVQQAALLKARAEEVKGCNAIVERVKQDRRNEEKRVRSAVEYGLKRDLRKYHHQGVMRKISMALARIELRPDGSPADAAVEVMAVQAASAWAADKVGLFNAEDFANGVYGLVQKFMPEAEAKAKTLQTKLGAKANLFGIPLESESRSIGHGGRRPPPPFWFLSACMAGRPI